tara:strand:- start:12532 stop:12873 length:342 start_codon:yes stop_codon:yes gene_type:complete
MKKLLFIVLVISTSFGVAASTIDCKNLYVGSIQVIKGIGLNAVVYLNNPGNSSGSYWSNFNGWSRDDKKEALSLLLMAKASNHRVNVSTESTGGCALLDGGTTLKSLNLTNNP